MLIASLILTTMDAVFELLIPYLSGLLITQGVNGLRFGAGLSQPNFYYIWLYSGLIIGLSLFAICAQASAMNIDAKISSDFVERLRNTIFWKAEQFSFSNIGHFPVSKLTTMLSNDCNNIRFFVLMLTRAGFKSPLMILISFVFIFSQSWLIGLITIPLSILSFIIIAIIIKKHIHSLSKLKQQSTMSTTMLRKIQRELEKLKRSVEKNIWMISLLKLTKI